MNENEIVITPEQLEAEKEKARAEGLAKGRNLWVALRLSALMLNSGQRIDDVMRFTKLIV